MAIQPTPMIPAFKDKPLTQEEINRRIKEAHAKRGERPEKINNAKLVAESGLRVVHIHPNVALNKTGMTVAFSTPRRVARFKRLKMPEITIAVASCNPSDVFCRKVGTKTAIEHHQAGLTVTIPVIQALGPIGTIKALFSRYALVIT